MTHKPHPAIRFLRSPDAAFVILVAACIGWVIILWVMSG